MTASPPLSPRSTLTWLLCDFVTGQKLAELPIVAEETIKRRIAAVEQTTGRLPLADPACPADWLQLLSFGRTMMVLAVDGEPTLAWFVEVGTIGEETVPLTLQTLETCAARTNVPEYDQGTDDDATAAAALCQPLVEGFGFSVDHTPVATCAGNYYPGDTEDRTIFDSLNELMAAGVIEWRIWIDWADHTHRQVTKTIEIAKTIGRVREHAVFDRDAYGRGNIERYTRTISYAPGKGATALQGVGDGSGGSRPMTAPFVSGLVAQGWPRWEERKQFNDLSPDAPDLDVELARRTRELAPTRERGTIEWSIVGTDTAPRPGRDYAEGDTIPIDVAPSAPLRPGGPAVDPVGGRTSSRVLGFELDTLSGQGTPQLWEDGDTGG